MTALRHPHKIDWGREWLRPGISENNWGVETGVITVCRSLVELQDDRLLFEIRNSTVSGRARGTGGS